MNSSQESQIRTRTFARTLGPFFAILAVMAMVHASDIRAMVDDFAANRMWSWTFGALGLLGGLIIITLHQYWRGAAAIIVSVLGWVLALRGLFILAFPQTAISLAKNTIGAATLTLSWTGFVILALIGLYLTYVGWIPAASRSTTQR